MTTFQHNCSVTTCGVQCWARRMFSKHASALKNYVCVHGCIQYADMTIVSDSLCNLHTSALEATLQISPVHHETQRNNTLKIQVLQ